MIWVWLVILLCCSATVSGSETALFAVDRLTLNLFRSAPSRLKRLADELMRHPRRVLMTVLIANTAINVAIFAASFTAMDRLRDVRPAVATLASLGCLVAVIIFGEIVPKSVALSDPRRFAPLAAAVIQVLRIVLAPLRWVLRTLIVEPLMRLLTPSPSGLYGPVTQEELRLLVEHSASEGAIDTREQEMLQAIVAAGDVSVREIMTPRVDIPSVKLGAGRQAILNLARSRKLRALLVRGRDLDDIRGVIYARDLLLEHQRAVRELVRPVRYVPEQLNLVQLLRIFRRTRIHFAVVVDEYGGTAGLVSSADVVEWIVGDLAEVDAAKAQERTERIDENTYRLPGFLSARLWAERFAVRSVDRQMATVGGLVVAKLGRMPAVGDSVRIRNLRLTVERVRKRRIERILLERLSEDSLPAEAPS